MERDPELVRFDVEAGLVTVDGAKRYGVVLDATGAVDADATTTLRTSLAKERGQVKLFDRGFESMDELKGRCLTETGLEPPVAPQFTKWALKAVGADR